jgi:glucose-6-phosphate-specific signal transduction histidine kinase
MALQEEGFGRYWKEHRFAVVLTGMIVGLAFLIAILAACVGRLWPGRNWASGAKPLLVFGWIVTICMVLALLKDDTTGEASLAPVLLALAGFLYLWWVAILLFDLIFVWHRYIRFGVAAKRVKMICGLELQNSASVGHPPLP